MPTEPVSLCFLDTCRDEAHVVLYASGNRLGGQITRERQAVAFCLKHGGQVYDQIRAWRDIEDRYKPLLRDGVTFGRIGRKSSSCPTWLVSDLRNNRLPRTSPDPKGWPAASPMAYNRQRRGR